MYLIWPNFDPDEAEGAPALFAEARRAGLPRLVYHSVLRPQVRSMPHHAAKDRVEEALDDAVAGTGARIRDTRKTLPGLRLLEKYAVRCGGGSNKRMGLYDVAMVKDNHVAAAGSVAAAVAAVRERAPRVAVQVEVDVPAQAVEAVEAGADIRRVDNKPPDTLREVVALVAGRAELEATGGLTLEVARAVAETGVDHLSVGALTHSAPILDLALDLRAG